jgi:hypothetical protein
MSLVGCPLQPTNPADPIYSLALALKENEDEIKYDRCRANQRRSLRTREETTIFDNTGVASSSGETPDTVEAMARRREALERVAAPYQSRSVPIFDRISVVDVEQLIDLRQFVERDAIVFHD